MIMIFLAKCKVDNGATIEYHKSVVKALNEKEAKEILKKYYAPGYDDVCYILNIKQYELRNGDVLEVS